MTDHVKQMLDTYPRLFNVDADLLTNTIRALVDCSNTFTQCADACLSEDDVAMMVKCIRLDLDCADICAGTSKVVSRQTDYDAAVTRALLAACAQSCKSCGGECAGHTDNMAHCMVCAEACRRCEDACNRLASATVS